MRLSKINTTFALMLCFLLSGFAKAEEEEEKGLDVYFRFNPSAGLIFSGESSAGNENESLQWNSKLESKLDLEGETFGFKVDLYMNYGQSHYKKELPIKTQDDFILSICPSMTIWNVPKVRLFFETTAETEMGEGKIGDRKTGFMDPLFVYNTLFIGQKHYSVSENGSNRLSLTYGVGYSYQETYTDDFTLKKGEEIRVNSAKELGYSATFELEYDREIVEDLTYSLSFSANALGKKDQFTSLKNSRVSVLGSSSLRYDIFEIDYSMRLLYDKYYSATRQLEQSLCFSLSFDI